jgi:hypothetical protein
MDVIDKHGTLEVRAPPPRRAPAVLLSVVVLGLCAAALGLARHGPSPSTLAAVLVLGGLVFCAGLILRRNLFGGELLLVGLFVRTGADQGLVAGRTSDLLAVGQEARPAPRSVAAGLAALGFGSGRLRLHTSQGDFLFGASLSDDELARLAWRLASICRDNARGRRTG